tara:strand:- start:1839 stop:2504 length:666 start_codon:yes stop_codon:yes gene_type:complete
MKIFLDTSSVDVIRDHLDTGLIDGVTTNPTLMLKEGKDPLDVIRRISDLFPEDSSISAEVTADTAEEMVELSRPYTSLGRNVTVKVPCTIEGLKACKSLTDEDFQVNVTLIFSQSQAILAAKAGATYVSPFVGRVDDNSFGGLCLVKDIANVFQRHHVSTEVLAASLRGVRDVGRAFEYGADIVTMPPAVFDKMYKHILTEAGLAQFEKDWQNLMGTNGNN